MNEKGTGPGCLRVTENQSCKCKLVSTDKRKHIPSFRYEFTSITVNFPLNATNNTKLKKGEKKGQFHATIVSL